MKTYNMKIEELNNEIEKLDKLLTNEKSEIGRIWVEEHIDFQREKINFLNQLRAEAIEEVKELRDIDTIDAEKVEVFEEVRRRDAIIDYLKTEWNITEGELR